MRIFKTKYFNKWASKEKLNDKTLQSAAKLVADGRADANLTRVSGYKSI